MNESKLREIFPNIKEEKVPFRPILMRFAAGSIGAAYREFYLDHETLVRANLLCLEKYAMDAVGLISDPSREAEAFGAKFEYPDDSVPHCKYYPVKTVEDVESLKNPDIYASKRTRDRVEGAYLFQKELNGAVPVIGWIEGPLAEACDLAGVSEMMMKTAMEPDFTRKLLEKVTATAKDFARAQIEAGCSVIGMGDAICSQISPDMYRDFVKDLHAEIIDDIHGQGAAVKLHICGNITHLLPHVKETGADIVDIDSMVDMEEAYRVLGPEIIRCGNLDPVAVIEQGSPGSIKEAADGLVAREKGRPFILSGGCEITPDTPEDNLTAMAGSVAGTALY